MALHELLLFRFPDPPLRLASSCTYAPVMSATPAVSAPHPAASRQVTFEFGPAGIPRPTKAAFCLLLPYHILLLSYALKGPALSFE
jgi:hypothetical protein